MLLFIDNIFRFTQAGSEVSALLGRMPSAVGYQPTLGTEMGAAAGADHLHQEGLDHVGAGDLRARRRHHRPGAGHGLRPPRRDHRALAPDHRARHLPGGRPARLDLPDPRSAHPRRGALPHGPRRAAHPPALQGPPGHHRDPRAWRSSPTRTSSPSPAPGRSSASSPSPSSSPRRSPARPGKYVKLADTVKSFREVVDGKHDELPEQAFYMVGDIDEAVEKAKKLAASG